MTKKVRIKKVSREEYWYADKIGEVFDVIRIDVNDFKRTDGPYRIAVEDCEIVHEIDGALYKEVDRDAIVGDIIVLIGDGDIVKVTKADLAWEVTEDAGVARLSKRNYRVLEPIDPPPKTTTDELLEITANLTRRVFDLERENKKLRDDVTETLGTITDLLRKRDRRIDELTASLDEVYLRLGHVEADAEEIERKVFDTSSLKPFDLATLNGKRVTLLHGEDGGYEILTAKDEDGNFYVISEKEACK